MPAIISTEKGKEINPIILKLLKNLEDYAATNKSIKINERSLTPKDYREYTLNKLNLTLTPNKLENAKIAVLTEYSEKYPVGGEKALNDKLFGALDFHHNWLGFEGHDMIAEIDFGKPTEFSQIRMNFLKAVNSWVFLPVKIKIEMSEDGKNFRVLEEKNTDDTDKSYLVKSIPFNFRFDPVKARYLRVTATSMKKCPEWHRGFGKPSWIFIDEIIVN
jgi:hexosaminidase